MSDAEPIPPAADAEEVIETARRFLAFLEHPTLNAPHERSRALVHWLSRLACVSGEGHAEAFPDEDTPARDYQAWMAVVSQRFPELDNHDFKDKELFAVCPCPFDDLADIALEADGALRVAERRGIEDGGASLRWAYHHHIGPHHLHKLQHWILNEVT